MPPAACCCSSASSNAALLSSIASASISAVNTSSGRRPSACRQGRQRGGGGGAGRRVLSWRVGQQPQGRGCRATPTRALPARKPATTPIGHQQPHPAATPSSHAHLVVVLYRLVKVSLQVIGVAQGAVGASLHEARKVARSVGTVCCIAHSLLHCTQPAHSVDALLHSCPRIAVF